jgi:hypothetical protein
MLREKTFLNLVALCLALSFSSCFYYPYEGENWVQAGYRPVYGTSAELQIAWENPRTITNPGKIYTYGSYLLINDRQRGIHVYDNSNPEQPFALGFISIPGNSDMAIKDDVLYADHAGELVSLTISDFNALTERGRLPINTWDLGVPPPTQSYYECTDPSQGMVIAWKETKLKNPSCYAE